MIEQHFHQIQGIDKTQCVYLIHDDVRSTEVPHACPEIKLFNDQMIKSYLITKYTKQLIIISTPDYKPPSHYVYPQGH